MISLKMIFYGWLSWIIDFNNFLYHSSPNFLIKGSFKNLKRGKFISFPFIQAGWQIDHL